MLPIKTLANDQYLDIELIDGSSEPESKEPHRHQYFEIFWVLQGSGAHSLDFSDYPLDTGQIYFITPGQVHHCPQLAQKMYAISFNANLIGSNKGSQQLLDQIFFQNRSSHPSIVIDAEGELALQSILTILMKELQSKTCDNELVHLLFTSLLRYVSRYQPLHTQPQIDDCRMVKLLELIDIHYTQHKHATFYAEQLSLSSKRVNELSQDYFGKTITQLIHEKTITEARRNLAFTNRTIKAIALELGYKDSAYFCRFFKKSTLESPQNFRLKWTK